MAATKPKLAACAFVSALLLTIYGAAQATTYPCPLVRWYVSTHSCAEIKALGAEHPATQQERHDMLACLSKHDRHRCPQG